MCKVLIFYCIDPRLQGGQDLQLDQQQITQGRVKSIE